MPLRETWSHRRSTSSVMGSSNEPRLLRVVSDWLFVLSFCQLKVYPAWEREKKKTIPSLRLYESSTLAGRPAPSILAWVGPGAQREWRRQSKLEKMFCRVTGAQLSACDHSGPCAHNGDALGGKLLHPSASRLSDVIALFLLGHSVSEISF